MNWVPHDRWWWICLAFCEVVGLFLWKFITKVP
jgi:hypothetical protein